LEAQPGGLHTGAGTQNALIRLGKQFYLEIVAPLAEARTGTWVEAARRRPEPHLHMWCVRADQRFDRTVARARSAGFGGVGPFPGSRTTPAGIELHWRLFVPTDVELGGTLPFLIDWQTSRHPALNLPHHVRRFAFGLGHPRPDQLAKALSVLGLWAPPIRVAPGPEMALLLEGPRGTMRLTS
jgi:hypothetical protein